MSNIDSSLITPEPPHQHDTKSAVGVEPHGFRDGMRLDPTEDGRWRIVLNPPPGRIAPRNGWVTAYPPDLINEIYAAKDLYVCDEICREEDPQYVERRLRTDMLSYIGAEEFAGKRLLDFGCGSGASTMVLSRLLPKCEIVGVELEDRLLKIANLRATHFGRHEVKFFRSPSGSELPDGIGTFDFVSFSAVFEHLLWAERQVMLPMIWDHLKPSGILFLNQTPHRYSPYENHTTRLPLINYLPDAVAYRFAKRFSKLVPYDTTWETLLRRGIRGGTVNEIMGILQKNGTPFLLRPMAHVGDRIDLWLRSLSSQHAWLKRTIWTSLKSLKALTKIELTPSLSLAIRKDG